MIMSKNTIEKKGFLCHNFLLCRDLGKLQKRVFEQVFGDSQFWAGRGNNSAIVACLTQRRAAWFGAANDGHEADGTARVSAHPFGLRTE